MTPYARPFTGYKYVMTKDALSLPHLLRGEDESQLCRVGESEAIGPEKARDANLALGVSMLVVSPSHERHMDLGVLGFESCIGRLGLPHHLQPCWDGAALIEL